MLLVGLRLPEHRQEVAHPQVDQARRLCERLAPRLDISFDCGGIGNTPVNFLGLARKDRALLAHPVANGDDAGKGFATKLVEMLRTLAADVQTASGHCFNGQRVYRAGDVPGAPNLI